METKTSELVVSCNLQEISQSFDVYKLQTSEKYIKKGSSALDLEGKITAESIAFTYGRSAFLLFRKGATKLHILQDAIVDPCISVQHVDVFDLKADILIRLLLNALGNSKYDGFSFNNLTGHLFYYLPEWVGKHSVKALDISVSAALGGYKIDLSACTFTDVKRFKKEPDGRYPRYTFSLNGTFSRVFGKSENACVEFVKKTPNGRKTEIPFFNFFAPKMQATRVSALYQVLDAFNDRYKGLCTLTLKSRNIDKKVRSRRDEDFVQKVINRLRDKTINIVNFDLESEDYPSFESFVERIRKKLPNSKIVVSDSFIKNELNIAFVHNEDYYKENKIDDPYKSFDRSFVIQCITAEDGGSSQAEAVINTILKEIVIKDDLINERRITLDDWGSFGFIGSTVFGLLDDDVPRFLEILPNGEIKTIHSLGIFHQFKEERFSRLKELLISNGKNGSVIIQNSAGSVIIIESTGINTLPSQEVLHTESPRGKNSKNSIIAGLIDINLYRDGKNILYNVGPVGDNLNMALPKGSVLYSSNCITGDDFTEALLETMSVMFVKYNSFTVLPYPVKYLREWSEIERRSQK